jgi:hypothetical protein
MFGARTERRRKHEAGSGDAMGDLSPERHTATRTGHLPRIVVIVALVGALVVVGTFAAVARPSTSTYCNGCTLSYNGTPAVTPTTQYYTYNAISLFLANNWHIYYYNTSTSNQSCDASGFDTYGGHNTCANTATARCQLLSGYGTDDTATCWADY